MFIFTYIGDKSTKLRMEHSDSLPPALQNFLTFDGVNRAWVAEQLYGSRSTSSTAKLHAKIRGTQNRRFSDAELAELTRIRKTFLEHLL